MFSDTFFFEPLTQTANSDAAGFPDCGIRVVKSGLYYGPNLAHKRGHEFTTTLHGNPKRKHGAPAGVGVGGFEVTLDKLTEGWEHLIRREVGCEAINDAESGLHVNI